jgi:hypothetical protein
VAELAGGDQTGVVTRDVFLSSGEGSQETFAATGMTPRLVHEFAARGIKLDAALFKRAR